MPDHRCVLKNEDSENLLKSKSWTKGHERKSDKKSRQFYLIGIFTLTCCIAAYFHLYRWSTHSHSANFLDNFSISLGLKNYVHSIVIDAGSTGSRILSYGFVSSPERKSLKLHKEFFREIKPGISFYADRPNEVVKSLEFLITEVKKFIPEKDWSKTWLLMKATAGLRLLPETKANALLREAKNYIEKQEFKIREDSVGIMDGTDEGLLSWFTVNFLLGKSSNTVVAMDLGGGSTQISFVPSKKDEIIPEQSQYVSKIGIFEKNLNVYSRSYLGLGLNEGRKRIFLKELQESNNVKSSCINPSVKKYWKYGGVDYTIQVQKTMGMNPVVDFDECEKIVKSVVSEFEKSPALDGKEIYAFSYYYEKASESGLVDFGSNSKVTINDLESTAKSVCSNSYVNQPFICLDLIYITALFRDVFGITNSTKINLVKYLDGHEVSWALGAAFLSLQNQM
ncbi:Ectonucleoside triphosphate diphosphohydrolase 5 precursor, putative [Pediculus humanus corporis]|uniref:Ectonucleoside triphosphate diphosphohydrolase 5, putative n=1 Tax=Pediculus humanus subsp. corporis TaxID=121224 RepID=E0W3F4_PEDHC|nr:Ectonucleoside triphosphate diphosphohydrolase 5 precursor, putative [Pediculus humanus corporis]EEB20160.1 Ectonucleoside triphosphate diphosphohydrolase 5 precursor, putative [Pediculus humanus corporis]